jgi:hypothetical protein
MCSLKDSIEAGLAAYEREDNEQRDLPGIVPGYGYK